ncbi:MAG: PAS domain S-box protein [Halobacteriales archaeon]
MTDAPFDDLLERTVNEVDDLFYVFTPEGEYLEWNDALTAVTGYTAAEIETLSPADLVPEADREAVTAAIEAVVETRESTAVEADLLTKDGTRIPYEFSGTPIEDDGELVAVAGVGRDISARQRREEELAAMAEEVRELSMPIVEVWEGILLSTVVGRLDSDRAERFTEALLHRIDDLDADTAIIDITAVTTVDTQTAQHLIDTIRATELLGAEVIITGINPDIAQTLVRLGIGFDVETRASLSDGLETALELNEVLLER